MSNGKFWILNSEERHSNIEVGEVLDKKLKRIILAKDFLDNTKDVKEVRKIKTKISFDNFDFENQDIINKIGKKISKDGNTYRKDLKLERKILDRRRNQRKHLFNRDYIWSYKRRS